MSNVLKVEFILCQERRDSVVYEEVRDGMMLTGGLAGGLEAVIGILAIKKSHMPLSRRDSTWPIRITVTIEEDGV